MNQQTPSTNKTKVCPTCGTRLSENAARCLVCGTEFNAQPGPKAVQKTQKSVQASRMPEITLSLPAAVGIIAVVIIVAVTIMFFALRATGGNTPLTPAESPTPTVTATASLPPTATLPPTDIPTPTPIPPEEYSIKSGDTCGSLAAVFHISITSIILTNNLSSDCLLSIGQVVKIPYPTATPPAAATNTPLPLDATKQACETVAMTVQQNDTLSSIAANWAVSADAIKTFNGKTTDSVFLGESLLIPLCMRAATPGPTPTATIPPPYPASNLLLPADGAAFTLANDVVTLQWASVGTLRSGEAYQVTVEDVTANQTRRLTDYVADTKYIVPTSFRPNDNVAHVLRWWITPVRQAGTDDQGQPIWVASGAVSEKRVFTWVGVAVAGTPTNP